MKNEGKQLIDLRFELHIKKLHSLTTCYIKYIYTVYGYKTMYIKHHIRGKNFLMKKRKKINLTFRNKKKHFKSLST